MRVILLQDIKGIGKKFDIKEVKDGFARNFLFPRKLAAPASPTETKKLEEMKESAAVRQKELAGEILALAKKLDGKEIIFRLKFNEKGEAFGAVGEVDVKKEISKFLPEKSKEILSRQIKISLEKPLKRAGEYEISVDFSPEASARLKIILAPEEK